MSGLVLKGDLTDYLGEYLPTTFIEKVDVYEQSIKVKLSLFLKAPAIDTDPTELLNRLDPLKIYISMVIGKQQIQDVLSGKRDAFASMLEADQVPHFPAIDCCDGKCKNTIVAEYAGRYGTEHPDVFLEGNGVYGSLASAPSMPPIFWAAESTGNILPLSHMVSLDDLMYVDTLFDENANKIYKYSSIDASGAFTIQFDFPHWIDDLFGTTPDDYTPWSDIDWDNVSDDELFDANGYLVGFSQTNRDSALEDEYPFRLCKDYQDLTLFTWTSPYEASNGTPVAREDGSDNTVVEYYDLTGPAIGATMSTGYQYHPNYDETLTAMRAQANNQGWDTRYLPSQSGITRNNPTLTNIGTSNISYVSVIEGGELSDSARVIYLDRDKNPWAGMVLQSLGGKYYKTVNVTHQQIIINFKALVAEYIGTNLSGLMQELLDNISYILSVYGESVELLTQLNSLRVVIPEQGNATIMGKLFNKITTRIANFDSSLGRENLLFSRLAANHIVQERRPSETQAWDITNYGTVGKSWEEWLDAQASAEYNSSAYRYLSDAEDAFEQIYEHMGSVFSVPGFGEIVQWGPRNDREILYTGDGYLMDSQFFGSSWETGIHGTEAEGYDSGRFPLVNHGYVFFDFEKYLYQRSRLSQVLDVEKLENWFGSGFVNMAVVPYSLTHERFTFHSRQLSNFPGSPDNPETDKENWETWMGLTSRTTTSMGGAVAYFLKIHITYDNKNDAMFSDYGNGAGTSDESTFNEDIYPRQEFPISIRPYGVDYYAGASGDGDVKETAAGSITKVRRELDPEHNYVDDDSDVYTYIIPHSFDVANSEGLGDYRLMTFEWQDVINQLPGSPNSGGADDWDSFEPAAVQERLTGEISENINGTVYGTTLKIFDRSRALIESLIGSYEEAQSAIEEYLTMAEELCSYNTTTDEFNQFFITGMETYYEANLAAAPWNRVPLIYMMHRDLLENAFGGSMEEVRDQAQSLSAFISPYYGTLESIREFKTDLEAFYNTNYAWDETNPTGVPYLPNSQSDDSYGGSFIWHVKQWDQAGIGDNTNRDWGNVETFTVYDMVEVPVYLVGGYGYHPAMSEAPDQPSWKNSPEAYGINWCGIENWMGAERLTANDWLSPSTSTHATSEYIRDTLGYDDDQMRSYWAATIIAAGYGPGGRSGC